MRNKSKRAPIGGLAVHFCDRSLQLVVISLPYFHHAILSVQSLPNHFVRLNELVNFSCELIILVANNSDMTIHWVNLNLQGSIVLNQSVVRVASAFCFFAHIHKLIFFLSNLCLQFFNHSRKFNVLAPFVVNASLQVSVLILVSRFKTLKVV